MYHPGWVNGKMFCATQNDARTCTCMYMYARQDQFATFPAQCLIESFVIPFPSTCSYITSDAITAIIVVMRLRSLLGGSHTTAFRRAVGTRSTINIVVLM